MPHAKAQRREEPTPGFPFFASSRLGVRKVPILTLRRAGANHSRMKLTWKDDEEIAWALATKFPDQDPLKLSFPKLHKMVTELEEFGDKPEASNEKILENIQMAWLDEKK